MKVLVVSTFVPFIEGGGTFIVDWLLQALKQAGYDAESLKIPFKSDYRVMLEQMLALRLLDFSAWADLLITIRTPSYLVRHPNKVAWFIHHHRGAYDLWGTPYQDIPDDPSGRSIRRAIIQADNLSLKETKKIFTNSQIVSRRLKDYNDLDSEVLYPPLPDQRGYFHREYGDYLFYPSRITEHKRQLLAIASLLHTKTKVKLIIAGRPEHQPYWEKITDFIKNNKLAGRVRFIDRWISHQEKIDLLADCLGCVYIPYEEDSYGYVALEAYYARKPVITCQDSGGTLELVEDGINGHITRPQPEYLAEAMDKLYLDRQLAARQGEAGLTKLLAMNITWPKVVERLIRCA